MPRQTHALVFLIISIALLSALGCAGLTSGYESPAVSISSFRALSGQTAVPRFEIGLHIINPNRTPLDLEGIAYTVSIEDHKILTGVANDLPQIEGYGEGNLLLQAEVDLFSSILFFTDLVRHEQKRELSYSFEAKLDMGAFHPIIRVTRKGKFNIRPHH